MTNKNKELPEGLVEEVARAICYHNDPLKTDDYRNWIVEAEASLSVIAPHYEKQIASLKSEIIFFSDKHHEAEKQIEELKQALKLAYPWVCDDNVSRLIEKALRLDKDK